MSRESALSDLRVSNAMDVVAVDVPLIVFGVALKGVPISTGSILVQNDLVLRLTALKL